MEIPRPIGRPRVGPRKKVSTTLPPEYYEWVIHSGIPFQTLLMGAIDRMRNNNPDDLHSQIEWLQGENKSKAERLKKFCDFLREKNPAILSEIIDKI